MAGARVPGHRGPKTKEPIGYAWIVRSEDRTASLLKVTILARSAKQVRTVPDRAAAFRSNHEADVFARHYAASPEEAIKDWRLHEHEYLVYLSKEMKDCHARLDGPEPKEAK